MKSNSSPFGKEALYSKCVRDVPKWAMVCVAPTLCLVAQEGYLQHRCFQRTPLLPTQALLCLKSWCPGGCSNRDEAPPCTSDTLSERNPLLLSLPRPHTAAVWPTCCCVCQVHSKRAQRSGAHTKAGALAPSQTLAVRKPQLSHNVKWAYKMPGEIAPRVD